MSGGRRRDERSRTRSDDRRWFALKPVATDATDLLTQFTGFLHQRAMGTAQAGHADPDRV